MPASHPTHRIGLLAACTALVLPWGALAAPQVFTVTDTTGRPVKAAAVSALVRGTPTEAPAGTQAQMGQRNKTFEPAVLVIQTGTQVSFPNFDTVRHHVYSFSPARPFEIKLYSGTPSLPVLFDKAGTATLGCNIHDRMLAYVHVVDTPYFGVSDAQGRVTLDLPAGDHVARIWTPGMGEKSAGQEVRFTSGRGPIGVTVSTP